MPRHRLRPLFALPLALWVAAVLAVPGIDGCPMHGLHAMRGVGAGAVAHAAAMPEMAGHAHHGAPTDRPTPDSRPTCDCPGDCSSGVDVALAPSAPVVVVAEVLKRAVPQAPPRALPSTSRLATRQPPSIGPPLA